VIIEVGFGRVRHRRSRLGAEILDDDFLQVAVLVVHVTQREQRLDAFATRFADPDQETRRVRDSHATAARSDSSAAPATCPASENEDRRVRRAGRRALEHHTHRHRVRTELLQLSFAQHAGIEVRQQARRVEHGSRRLREVVGRRRSPELRQCIARDRITQLRLVAQREQRLLAAGRSPGASDLEHVVDRQVGFRQVTRPMRERAVVTHVAAELRQRDEDLARIADRAPEALDRGFATGCSASSGAVSRQLNAAWSPSVRRAQPCSKRGRGSSSRLPRSAFDHTSANG
jgi:hypothetical protein